MIPTYLQFIHFQDKRVIPFFYSVMAVVLGFYWKNNDYKIIEQDAAPISVLLAILLFNSINDLKAYWAYRVVVRHIDFAIFDGQHCCATLVLLSRPAVISTLSILAFWVIVKCCLIFSSIFYSIVFLYMVSPLYLYLVFRWLRPIYICQLLASFTTGVSYKNLYHYLGCYIVPVIAINLISVSPLAEGADFSVTNGFSSAKIMISTFILCIVVLAVNLFFALSSKRYIFLGRIFLQEISFFFSQSIPLRWLYAKSFTLRILLLLLVMAVWITCISTALSLLQWKVIFEVYFLLCFLPCLIYYFLHVYWHWHNEFLMACDMYLRYEEYNKRNH